MKNTRILARGVTVSNDTWTTGLNNNDLIIGPSGGGKTRGYVIPNILQSEESIIVADTKGTLRRSLSGVLRRRGYQVIDLDFTDCANSPWGYNPLRHIRRTQGGYSQQDIISTAACLIPLGPKEPFWDHFARMFLESMIAYTLDFLPEDEHNLTTADRLFQEMDGVVFDQLFRELEQLAPDSFAFRRYRDYHMAQAADRMYSSVQGILAANLAPFTFDGMKAMFQNWQTVSFSEIGRRKTAVFLTVSDTDHSLDDLVTLFYTQALQNLCCCADANPDGRLTVPVRLILDDFAANACIPDFDKTISVSRSREISVSLVLQSLSQLESLYGKARSKTILNNCDHCLYLGGQDVDTARRIIHCILKPKTEAQSMTHLRWRAKRNRIGGGPMARLENSQGEAVYFNLVSKRGKDAWVIKGIGATTRQPLLWIYMVTLQRQ